MRVEGRLQIRGEATFVGDLFAAACRTAMCVVAAWTVVSICYLNLGRLLSDHAASVMASAAIAGVLVLLAFAFRFRVLRLCEALAEFTCRLSPRQVLILAVVAGLVVRLIWVTVYDAPLRSDGATYWELAERIYDGQSYLDPRGDWAYWPPGLPFWLFLNFLLFGVHEWVPKVGNIVLYVCMAMVVFRSAKLIGVGDSGLRWVAIWVAIWPAMAFSAGLNSKELLLATLLPTAIHFYLMSGSAGLSAQRRTLCLFGAGFAVGGASLTQPSFLLLPSIFVVDALYRRLGLVAALRSALLVGLGMAVCIGPWTARNYEVFGSFVPIATNGGDVFYRANNPQANGHYLNQAEVDLRQYGELERSRVGAALGRKWIQENPADFVLLALMKQIHFLGDNATGVFETMKRGLEIEGRSYVFWKGFTNAFWLMLWLLVFVLLVARKSVLTRPDYVLLQLPFLYFLLIDSVFESGSRHNVPVVPMLLLLTTAVFPAARAGCVQRTV